jgi:ribonuclease D
VILRYFTLSVRFFTFRSHSFTGASKDVKTLLTGSVLPPDQAGALLDELKGWRKQVAAAAGVPAYIVFGDKDLEGIAMAAPESLEALSACKGIGPTKLRLYGEEVLGVIRAFRQAPPAPALPAEEPEKIPKEQAMRLAAEAVAGGQAVAEAARAIGRAESTTWQYLLDWVAQDQTDTWKRLVGNLITPDDYRAMRAAFREQADGRLRPVFDRLEGRYTYEQIRLAKAVLDRQNPAPREG